MMKNEVLYKTKVFLILLLILFISSIESITTNNSVRNSKSKANNRILSQLNKNRNQESTVVRSPMTPQNIKDIVQTHNDLRNKVAMGQTAKGASLPQAANMNQVYWSATIARGAQEWADRCAMGHSPRGKYQYQGKGLGENIAMRGGSGGFPVSAFIELVNNWFSEIKDYNGNPASFQSNGGPVVGHFTQVVWAKTFLIGCGYCTNNKGGMTNEYLVCQYHIAGNMINDPIYQVKQGQCQCSQGYACKNKDYPGLCCPDAFNWCQKESFMWTD